MIHAPSRSTKAALTMSSTDRKQEKEPQNNNNKITHILLLYQSRRKSFVILRGKHAAVISLSCEIFALRSSRLINVHQCTLVPFFYESL